VSVKPDGDPVADAQAREVAGVDVALEGYVGWCRGCRYQVRQDAEGRRRCPECGLDAVSVIEDAHRFRARPRAARWMAWSMIGFASLLGMNVYGSVISFASYSIWLLFGWWSSPYWGITPHALIDQLMHSMFMCVDLILLPLTAIVLVAVAVSARLARVLDRRVAAWVGVALVAIALNQAFLYSVYAGAPVDAWLIPRTDRFADHIRYEIIDLIVDAASVIGTVGAGLAMHRRWPAQVPPGRSRIIITLTAIALLLRITHSSIVAMMQYEAFAYARHASHRTPAIVGHISTIYFEFGGHWLVTSGDLLAWVAAVLLLATMLCRSGHAIATLVSARKELPNSDSSRRPPRRNNALWVAAAFLFTALMVAVVMPVHMDSNEPWRPDIGLSQKWIDGSMALPFMIPVLGGAVRRSWRFGFLLIGVSIVASAIGGVFAVALFN